MEFNELQARHAYMLDGKKAIYITKKDRDINRIDGIYADLTQGFYYKDFWMVSDDWYGSITQIEEKPRAKEIIIQAIFEYKKGVWA